MNATKRRWKFVPCTWASSREGPVSERRYSSWHCDWTGCGRSETRSDSCSGRRRDQVHQVRWCVAVQAAIHSLYSTRCLTGSQWRSRSREVTWSKPSTKAPRPFVYILSMPSTRWKVQFCFENDQCIHWISASWAPTAKISKSVSQLCHYQFEWRIMVGIAQSCSWARLLNLFVHGRTACVVLINIFCPHSIDASFFVCHARLVKSSSLHNSCALVFDVDMTLWHGECSGWQHSEFHTVSHFVAAAEGGPTVWLILVLEHILNLVTSSSGWLAADPSRHVHLRSDIFSYNKKLSYH